MTLHVVAELAEVLPDIAGLQFRIIGMPLEWNQTNVYWVWDQDVPLSFGNPIFGSEVEELAPGAVAAFTECRDGAGTLKIPVGRIIVNNAPVPPNTTLRVVSYPMVPTDPQCPFMLQCNPPFFSKQCVDGGVVILNPTYGQNCGRGGPTAVEDQSWSLVKAMYR